MPSLRDEITKVVRRLGGHEVDSPEQANLPETIVRPDPREGLQIGSYGILRRLGSGGMGQVYLALDKRLGRHVALKFLSSDLIADPSMLFRLQQEARTASALNHPNILTIYEIAELNGEYFIASEFVDGANLRYAMQRQALTFQTALDIATQVASALVAAHAAGVVHRDLKPGNIMLRSDGYVKVIDFGLAKNVNAANTGTSESKPTPVTISGGVVGTVRYMSPEQARGDAVDHRTDLWSLGVVIYEMIANRRPFEGRTESHVVVAILDHPVPRLPEAEMLPTGVSRIIERALAKDPADRYQSATAMLADLQEIGHLSRSGTTTRRAALAQARRAVRLHRGITASLAAIALAVLFSIWWWPLNGRYRFFAPEWFNSTSTQRATFEGNVRLAAISRDGKYLAYVAGGEIRIRNLDGSSDIRVSPVLNNCGGLTFSPDGHSIYSVFRDPKDAIGRLYRIALPTSTSGRSRLPALVLEDLDGPITFSPDGQQFAYIRNIEQSNGETNSSIVLASTASARDGHTLIHFIGVEIKPQLAWSPRGDQIAAVVFAPSLDKATRAEVMLISPAGRVLQKFSTNILRNLSSPTWLSDARLLALAGMPQNSKQTTLYQLFIPTGLFREVPPGILNFDELSSSADGRTLAAVGSDKRSSLWIANADNLDAARRMTPDSEEIDSFSWAKDGEIIYPSARTGSLNLWRVDENGTSQLSGGTDSCVEDWPAAVPSSSTIVYSSNCGAGGDDFDLWSLDGRTGQRTQLTDGSTYDYEPTVSPDGKWIFYRSWPSSITSIWKMPVSGGTPIRVSPSQARYPSVSPNGEKLLCHVREASRAWRVAILDIATRSIDAEFPKLPIDSPPHWSPDGTAIDYLSSETSDPHSRSDSQPPAVNIWRQPVDNRPPHQLTHLAENSVTYFAWSRNGDKLAYVRARPASDVVLYRSTH